MTDNSVLFETKESWMVWLQQYHATCPGAWLRFAKKNSGIRSLSHPEALEAALCYGWIDGQKKTGPEGMWLQRFTPRGERSIWSQVNRAAALALIDSGRMQAAGLAAVARAKENGQWEAAYEAVAAARIPDDLASELDAHAAAKEFFEQLSSQNRYAILFRLQTAKKPETRAKRLERFVQMLKQRQTIYPQRSK